MHLHALPASLTPRQAQPHSEAGPAAACDLAPPLHGSPAAPARPHVPLSHPLRFSNQMAAPICATAMGDAHWVRTAGSVSARPAGEGPDATLPWKPPVLITRIMREVSKRLLIPSPSRTEHGIYMVVTSHFSWKISPILLSDVVVTFPLKQTQCPRANGGSWRPGLQVPGFDAALDSQVHVHRKVAGPWLCLWGTRPARPFRPGSYKHISAAGDQMRLPLC